MIELGAPALACLACGRLLKNVFEEANNQPSGGLAFRTFGHYGTTAFDPLDNSYLEINLCDPCVTRAQQRKRVYFGYADIAPYHLILWEHQDDEELGGEAGHE